MARYLEGILARFKKQEQKGIAKYGQRLEDNPRPVGEAIEYALEEVTDLMMYLEESKEKVEKMERVIETVITLRDSYGKDAQSKMNAWHEFVKALAEYEGKDDISEL